MTTFLKVWTPLLTSNVRYPCLTAPSVPRAVLGGERIRVGRQGWEQVTCIAFGFHFAFTFLVLL